MKAAVISNGNKPSNFNCDEYDLIVCADGAVHWALQNNIRVDAIIGDMDSADSSALKAIEIIKRYNLHKDETDTWLAIDYAYSQGADCVHLYGALGKRLDHMLANLALLYKYKKAGQKIMLIDDYSYAYAAKGEIDLDLAAGKTISVFPLEDNVTILETRNLKYPVYNRALPVETPYFISNVTTGNPSIIKTDGWVMIIVPVD
ncbi:MAG TPA: thiamine diphosphokinase [Clostridia bacterium]|nr:thiamine diphosphokinase [Clostridia bacterium]